MTATPLRVVVLISGRGSNLQALLAAQHRVPQLFEIVLVASNRVAAEGLRTAETACIPTFALEAGLFANRAAYDAALFSHVAAAAPDLIVLAGFMRILDPAVLAPWDGKIINIHPSLLPKYPGLHTHRRALAAGDKQHGASVHFVSAELDAGPLIAQVELPIDAGDDADSLALRLLPREHALLRACVEMFAQRRIALSAAGVRVDGHCLNAPLRLNAQDQLLVHGG